MHDVAKYAMHNVQRFVIKAHDQQTFLGLHRTMGTCMRKWVNVARTMVPCPTKGVKG